MKQRSLHDIIQHSINYILLLCFLLVPTVFWLGHFHPFVAIKEFVFAVSVCSSVGLLAISCLCQTTIALNKNRLTLSVLIYYTYTLISFMVFPYTDRRYFFLFTCLILLFFVISSMTEVRHRDRILHALIFVALLASIYGCFQFIGMDFRQFSRYFGGVTLGSFEGMRIFTFFGHPNLLGGFCVCTLPIMTTFLITRFQEKKFLHCLYLSMALGLTLLALFLSRTRGSWLAAGLSCCIPPFVLWRKRIISIAARYKITFGIIVLVMILTMVGLFSVLKTSPSLTDTTSLNIRLEYYRKTLSMIKERVIFGRGIGTFNVYYPLYRDNRIAARLGEPAVAYRVEHPHNEHLELLNDGGMIGYGLFLWIVIEAGYRLVRKTSLIARGLAISLFGLLVDGLFSQNLRFIVIASLLWLLIGCANLLETDEKHFRIHCRSSHENRLYRPCGVVLAVAVCVGMMWAVRFAYNTMQADYYVKGGMSYYTANRPQTATGWFQQALSLAPHNKRARYYLASAYRLTAEFDKALESYAALLARDPNFLQANYYLGGLYAKKKAIDQAKFYFERQIAGDNLHWKAYYNLALIALHQNETRLAIHCLKEIEKIDTIRRVDSTFLTQVKDMLIRLQ